MGKAQVPSCGMDYTALLGLVLEENVYLENLPWIFRKESICQIGSRVGIWLLKVYCWRR